MGENKKRVIIQPGIYKELMIEAALREMEIHEIINEKLEESIKNGNSNKIKNLVRNYKDS